MTESKLVNVTVSVTVDDIASGTRQDYRSCPIALAMNRLLLDGFFASIGNPRFSIRELDRPLERLVEYKLPGNAYQFIIDFDRYYDEIDTKPFDFGVRLPAEYLRETEKGGQP